MRVWEPKQRREPVDNPFYLIEQANNLYRAYVASGDRRYFATAVILVREARPLPAPRLP